MFEFGNDVAFAHNQASGEIPHAFQSVTTRQFHTGTTNFVDIPGAILGAGNFTQGEKYLLVITAQVDFSNDGREYAIKTLHGSTDFQSSIRQSEPAAEVPNSGNRFTYNWFGVWDVDSSAKALEDIKLQFQTFTSGTETVGADQITMTAIQISDLTEGTDWFYDNQTATTDFSNLAVGEWAPSNNATIKFTPENDNDDWLVMTTARMTEIDVTDPLESGIAVNGTNPLSSGGVLLGNIGEDSSENDVLTVAWVYTLHNTQQQFSEQSRNNGDDVGIRSNSAVFALRLNAFDVHSFGKKTAETTLTVSGANYDDEVLTPINIEPNVAGDVWILGQTILDGDPQPHIRMRVNTTSSTQIDAPDTQTDDLYTFSAFELPDEELPWMIQNMSSLSAAVHTINMTADENSGAGALEDSLLLAITMKKGPRIITLTENLGMTANVATTSLLSITLPESLGFSDIANTNTAFTLTLPESLGLADTLKATNLFTLTLPESLGLADTLKATNLFTITLPESLGLADTIDSDAAFTITLPESLGFSDIANTNTAFTITLPESLGLVIRVV